MIRNKVSIEHQIDERTYQFLIPSDGTWNEALMIVNEISKYCSLQIESSKKESEQTKLE